MTMVGTPVVLVSRNTTRLVKATTSKARVAPATASIKNVVRNVPDTTTPPAISLPDTSKPEAVRAVPALNIRLNAILIHQIRGLMLTVALRAAAGRAVKMTAELITPNAPAQLCMNGARQRKNVSARRDINIPAPAATSAAVRAIAATTNTKNANVKPDLHGMPLAECAFATAPTGARLIKIAPAWVTSNRAVRANSSNAHSIPITPFAISSNAKRLLVYSPDGAAVTLSSKRGNVKEKIL